MLRKIMYSNILLLGFLISGALFGMDNSPKRYVWNKTATHYAYVGDSQLYKGAHICMQAYPVVVKRAKDNQIKRWLNFDNPVKSVQFKGNMLWVTLKNMKTYQFSYT